MVLLVVLSLFLMSIDHKQQHLQTLHSGLAIVVAPLRYIANLPSNAGHWISETLESRQQLQQENTRLKAQNFILRGQMLKYAAIESENRRLRGLLGSSFKVSDQILIAELTKVDTNPYKHVVWINKGSSSRYSGKPVYIDQPILDAHGVMGQIIKINAFESRARLITDPSHTIPVQINRSGLRTLAVGTGTINRLQLPYLPVNANIRKGDLLVTSGLGQVYPPGYPVARVIEVSQTPGQRFLHVIAEPTAHLDRSREVLLVWSGEALKMNPAPGKPGKGGKQ